MPNAIRPFEKSIQHPMNRSSVTANSGLLTENMPAVGSGSHLRVGRELLDATRPFASEIESKSRLYVASTFALTIATLSAAGSVAFKDCIVASRCPTIGPMLHYLS